MRRTVRWIGLPVVAAVVALMAGCAVNPNFVYKPNPAAAGGRKLPVKVAVLPFEDGTENFTKRGSVMGDGQYNLAKTGISGGMTAMPPEFWGKVLRRRARGLGQFPVGPLHLQPLRVQGRGLLRRRHLEEGHLRGHVRLRERDSRFLPGHETVRQKGGLGKGNREGMENPEERVRRVRPGDAVHVRQDARRLEHVDGRRPGRGEGGPRGDACVPFGRRGREGAGAKPAGPPAPESVEQTIDKILKGK